MILNFNIGVVGHVDSGKTALVKAISTTASTACFDKAKQSQERGITLDLGFSSFALHPPSSLTDQFDSVQMTMVDCPGHASLIRTIIGGAQIIDLMLLVIDVTKGFQTQTAECLVIGDITCDKLLVVLNKIDLLDEGKRQALIDKMTKRVHKTLDATKFHDYKVIPVSATDKINMDTFIDELRNSIFIPHRDPSGNFRLAIDHCFAIKGQGTILTGTVLSGSIGINDSIEILPTKVTRKIKSMQSFKQSVTHVSQGDRVGICVTNFEAGCLERGIATTPGSLQLCYAVISPLHKIKYYQRDLCSKNKLHISVAHETTMATMTLFATKEDTVDKYDPRLEYQYVDSFSNEQKSTFVLLEFDKPLYCPQDAILIGSKLDVDVHSNSCRIAFHGRAQVLLTDSNYGVDYLKDIKVYKENVKKGSIERMVDGNTVIVRDLFKKETDLQAFRNLKVALSTGETGFIESSFGQSGKIKVRVPAGLEGEALKQLADLKKKKTESVDVSLTFRKFVFDSSGKHWQ